MIVNEEAVKKILEEVKPAKLVAATKYVDVKEIEKLEKEFSGNGRVLIRASGTEPLVRVMIEGENQEYITEKAKDLANLIEERL